MQQPEQLPKPIHITRQGPIKKRRPGHMRWRYLVSGSFDEKRLDKKFVDLMVSNSVGNKIESQTESAIKIRPINEDKACEYRIIYQADDNYQLPIINQVYSPLQCINLSDNKIVDTSNVISAIEIIQKTPIFYEKATRGSYPALEKLDLLSKELSNIGNPGLKRLLQFCSYFGVGMTDKLLCIARCTSIKNQKQTSGAELKENKLKAGNPLDMLVEAANAEIENTQTDNQVIYENNINIATKSFGIAGTPVKIKTGEASKLKHSEANSLYISAVPQVLELYTNVIRDKTPLSTFFTNYVKAQRESSKFESTKLLNITLMNRVINRLEVAIQVSNQVKVYGLQFAAAYKEEMWLKKAKAIRIINLNIIVNMIYTEVYKKGTEFERVNRSGVTSITTTEKPIDVEETCS